MKNQSVSTQKGQFNKSLGTGVKSLFSAKGRRYYILEHRTATASHRAGEVQEIIVDYIELGRDRKCQVHFDESQATVSRRHAAISAENSKWVIKNLSQSNPTLVNNRPVSNHWYLQHGDEIQLSVEGPKIGFIVPQNNTVKSIGLSRRFSLFRKQALRPYKRAIAYMGLFFLALVSALAVYLYQTREELYSYKVQLADFKEISAEQADSLTEQLSQSKKHNAVLQESFNSLQKTVKKIQQTQVSQSQSNTHPDFHFNELINGVCLVSVDKITVTYEGEMQSVENCALGTGFFLNDGRFITSRHVAEPWLYPDKGEDFLLQINLLATAGAEVVSYITAISPDGSSISFTNKEIVSDDSQLFREAATSPDGESVIIRRGMYGSTDWVSVKRSHSLALAFDNDLSQNLKATTKLDVLGYPMGMTASRGDSFSPIYGSCVVGADGLGAAGNILISQRNFEKGNSGGPVFVKNDSGKFVVVGLVEAGIGEGIGIVIPISATR